MTRKLIALATAASISAAAAAPAFAQDSMGMGFNMLTGALYNELQRRNIDTGSINDLSLSQIAIIQSIVNDGESEGSKKQRIEAVLNR